MTDAAVRTFLRRQLEAHLCSLGYSCVHARRLAPPVPQIARVSPVRGRIAYGETVLRRDLQRRRCHERLLSLSQRRTRRRSTILLFIAVAERDRQDLEALLERLNIQNGIRGGHVHVVTFPPAAAGARTRP
jgi:hypothetical protein